jgi:hypothetical protein
MEENMDKRLITSNMNEKYNRVCWDIAEDVQMIGDDYDDILYEEINNIIEHITQHSLVLTDREAIIRDYFRQHSMDVTYGQLYDDITNYIGRD